MPASEMPETPTARARRAAAAQPVPEAGRRASAQTSDFAWTPRGIAAAPMVERPALDSPGGGSSDCLLKPRCAKEQTPDMEGVRGSARATDPGRGPDPPAGGESRAQGAAAEPNDVTVLLRRAQDGDRDARDRLYGVVCDELGRIARIKMARQRRGHTLETLALVNEAYLKLSGSACTLSDRAHFFATAARAMEQVLCDHAKGRKREKRAPPGERICLDVAEQLATSLDTWKIEVLDLRNALEEYSAFEPRGALIARYRIFAGLAAEEIAEVLETSSRTVEREWRLARAWLAEKLGRA